MRLAVIIVALAVTAVLLVHIRREEMVARHEIQRAREESVALRRDLQEQQVKLGFLTAPMGVENRAGQMAMEFIDKNAPQPPERPMRLAGAAGTGHRQR